MFAEVLALALAAQQITIPLQKTPRQVERAIAPIAEWGPRWAAECDGSTDWDKPAPPVRIHGNTYLVGTCGISAILITGTDGHILIDAGTEKGADLIADNIRFLDFVPSEVRILLHSHEHLDHVGGTAYLHEHFSEAQIVAHRDEAELYYSLPNQPLMMGIQPHQLQAMGMDYSDPPRLTRFVEDKDVLDVGDIRFEIRHCPGHTLGHIVLIEANQKTVFTGDCLFSGTIGRTDLPGGDYDQLIRSIEEKILTLPDDFIICCGHGPNSTVGRERAGNPFLNGAYDRAQFGR